MDKFYPGKLNDTSKLSFFACQIADTVNKYLGTESLSGDSLSLLHNYVPVNSINQIRLEAFQKLNELDYSSFLHEHFFGHLSSLLGPDLLIQKQLNLSIQMPDDSSSVLHAHTDCSSGDSPFEVVLWLPLTDTFKTNSMFICSKEQSIDFYSSMKKNQPQSVKPKLEDFVAVPFGSYIIFSPSLVHGNVVNTTNRTRISLNIRFKSVFSPYTPTIVHDRLYGTYFKMWNSSNLFELGREVYTLLK